MLTSVSHLAAVQVGYELPSFYEHIKQGLPFKASFDAKENEPAACEQGLSWST